MTAGPTLVLGGAGMLGHKVVQAFVRSGAQVSFTLRGSASAGRLRAITEFADAQPIENLDAANPEVVIAAVRRLQPDVIVNCIGVVKQRAASRLPIPSIAINALLPHQLASAASSWGGRVFHFSTDCVFSGTRGSYTESDQSDADDVYGRTKYLGEIEYPNALTLRTSIIGRELNHHQALLDWFLSQNHREVLGFRRAWWSGVTTNHLADLVLRITTHESSLSGLYQVSSGRISKYDLLCLLRDAYCLDVTIKPDDSMVCDRSLIGAKLMAAMDYVCPSLEAQIADLVADPTPYHTLS